MSVLEPGKMPVPFASSGLKNPIPPNSDPVTGRAGYNQGFPAINMTAKEAGGIPPYGQDFNGILFDITNALRFTQQGGIYTYSQEFATAIGGYTKGAMLLGKVTTALYQNQIDGNLTDPEASNSAGWFRFGPSSYGVPMIGELIYWPSPSMPQDIWPDIGAKFIPYMGQSFSKTLYPILAQLHPSGKLPADMRGEFVRGWDNDRGVDAGRAIMSAQGDAMRNIRASFSIRKTMSTGGTPNIFSSNDGAITLSDTGGQSVTAATSEQLLPHIATLATFDASRVVPTANEFRPRSIAWNMIVRAA